MPPLTNRAATLTGFIAGCGSAPTIGSREHATLTDALSVLEVIALGTELTQHGVATAASSSGSCPDISGTSAFTTLNYADACEPPTGLVPAGMTGSIQMTVGSRITATLDNLRVGSVAPSGELDARATPVTDFGLTLTPRQEIDRTIISDVTVGLGQAPPWRISGSAEIITDGVSAPIDFDEVELSPDGACLKPKAGSITAAQGLFSVVFGFSDGSAVTVARSDGATASLTACDHWQSVFLD